MSANPVGQDDDADAPPDAAPPGRRAAHNRTTPMMDQYLSIKQDHPDSLLFYRMGDFFELFMDDAVRAAEALDITLTRRGKHLGEDIAMCGVPVHSHETYLERLIGKGFKVAICEQVEDPAEAKKRGSKAVVRRDVIRVVTPGTLTEDTLLDARANNFLVGIATVGGRFAVAWMDVSTGALLTQACDRHQLGTVLARLSPGEILISESLATHEGLTDIITDWRAVLTVEPPARFDSDNARRRLERLYGVDSLDAFGTFDRAEVAAAGSLVAYVELTQKGRLPRIAAPRQYRSGSVMEIDAATRRNLELTRTLEGERKGSLLSVMDRTLTGPGARLLISRLGAPLTDPDAINDRLDTVQFFVENPRVRDDVRDHLRGCPDIERALSRLSIDRGAPRDLVSIVQGLNRTLTIRTAIGAGGGAPAAIDAVVADLEPHAVLVESLVRALVDEPPVRVRDGGFIRPGYAPDLDEWRSLRDESKRLIAGLQSRYQQETGINTLKVRYNNVLGYFVEVSAKQGDRVMALANGPFIHRQTLANTVRFTTAGLDELEGKISQAAEKALALETEIFRALVEEVMGTAESLARTAQALAVTDVAASLAEIAVHRQYTRPVLNDDMTMHVTGGRHPVVEDALARAGGDRFVTNDTDLCEGARLWLLTGPNMAGKSTFLRQNALIVLLAQTGCYVPATKAHMGIVDRLFSRVGASDDLARGRSTFMVEMVETAAILNLAGPRSLVILDEIGRGTATFDGLSIAWSVVEHLHNENKCRALFATHYHELTALAARLDDLSCFSMRVKEWEGDVVFLHQIAAGAADRSYGIHVGRLAGLPPSVIACAEQILATLEQGEQSSALTRLASDLPLFAAGQSPLAPQASTSPESPILEELDRISIDDLTPRDALDLLYKLKEMT